MGHFPKYIVRKLCLEGILPGLIMLSGSMSDMVIYTVSQKTGPLRLIWHNFPNSQHLLIIFGRDSLI